MGLLSEGYLRLRFGGLIFRRAYFWGSLLSEFYGISPDCYEAAGEDKQSKTAMKKHSEFSQGNRTSSKRTGGSRSRYAQCEAYK